MKYLLAVACLVVLGCFAWDRISPAQVHVPLQGDIVAPQPAAPAAPVQKSADKDLAEAYASYNLKVELVQRRSSDARKRLYDEIDKEWDRSAALVVDLRMEQNPLRQAICKKAELPDACLVNQDQKTGEWKAVAPPTVSPATTQK